MNIVELYFILLKGTATSFAGLASMPVIQDSLVTHRHVLTAEQLNEAVVITRSTPGPVGLWVVSAGYFAAGIWLSRVRHRQFAGIEDARFRAKRLQNTRGLLRQQPAEGALTQRPVHANESLAAVRQGEPSPRRKT